MLSEVDGLRAKKGADFITWHSLERFTTERKISKVKHILSTLGSKLFRTKDFNLQILAQHESMDDIAIFFCRSHFAEY